MNTQSFSITEALSFGFRMLARNFWLVLGLMLAGAGIKFGAVLMSGMIIMQSGLSTCLKVEGPIERFENATVHHPATYKNILDCVMNNINPLMLILLISLLAIAFSFVLLMGWNRIALDLYDHGTSQFNRIFVTFPLFLSYFITGLLYFFIVLTGMILLIIPGIIWALKYGFFDLIIIDTGCGPTEALSKSGHLTYGHKWQIFFFALIGVILIRGSAFTIVGPFIFMYVLFLSRAYIYRTLQGRKKEHA